jgi:hypothetical protein
VFNQKKKRVSEECLKYVEQNEGLGKVIESFDGSYKSTGASLFDYVFLHRIVTSYKPNFLLECGTGKTTFVIADAMDALMRQNPSYKPSLVSMEHNQEWYELQGTKFLSDKYPFVEIVLSPKTTWGYGFLRGSAYQEVPNYPYDVVFVDGPGQGIDDKGVACNIDFLRHVQNSSHPTVGITDSRKSTFLAHLTAFGPEKAQFFPIWGLGIIKPVTSKDVIVGNTGTIKKSYFSRDVVSSSKSYKSLVPLNTGDPLKWLASE